MVDVGGGADWIGTRLFSRALRRAMVGFSKEKSVPRWGERSIFSTSERRVVLATIVLVMVRCSAEWDLMVPIRATMLAGTSRKVSRDFCALICHLRS